MNIPYVMKKCSKCGKWLVASTVNFYKDKSRKDGLTNRCKECRNKKNKQWYEANKDKMIEYRKQYYEANKEKVAEQQKQWREDNPEYGRQYREANKEKIAKQRKQYREANKEKIAKQRKQYRDDNKDKILEYSKQYRENNKERLAEYHKQWQRSPQGQALEFNRHQRRRTKEEQQGTGITKDQWLDMMNFFDWRCAYSGEYLGGSNNSFNRTIDHIVPLNSGGDNMIWNCVPMTRSLNSSKNDKDMLEWYKQQSFYSEARLQKIYDWQEFAYNKWGKDTEYFNTNDIQIKLI